jgi:hypothetical protein
MHKITIDMTPRWQDIIGVHLNTLEFGTNEMARAGARAEIRRLAEIADEFRAQQWCDEIDKAPTNPDEVFLGLWRHGDTIDVKLCSAAKEPIKSETLTLRFVDAEQHYYLVDPVMFALLPSMPPKLAALIYTFSDFLEERRRLDVERGHADAPTKSQATLLRRALKEQYTFDIKTESDLISWALELGFSASSASIIWSNYQGALKRRKVVAK